MPVYTKRMVGERTGNGVVPMNTPFPRPERETAVGRLTDGPHPAIHAENLVRGTAVVRLFRPDGDTVNVAVEASNGDPYPGGNWVAIAQLTGVEAAGPANRYGMEFDLGYRFLRFSMSDAESDTLIEVDFQGMSR